MFSISKQDVEANVQAAQQPQEAQGSNKSPDSGKKSSKGESFLKGTFILTIAGFVVKVIGSLNWIFVSRILGGEGIGLYQMAFPIYFFAMTVSQAGVPVAISIITAERVALKDIYGAKRVFRISMGLMLVTGLLFSVLTYFAADWLIEWHFIRDARAYLSMVVLAPTVFFVTLLAASRGYLQGWQRMTPTAVSQIVEQIFRVITMILLAQLFLPWGLEYASAGASLGALVGAVTGLIVLVYYHWKLDRDIERNELIYREASINDALAIALREEDPLKGIQKMLWKIGSELNADRISIFERGEEQGTVSNTYEWCRNGVEPMKAKMQRVPLTPCFLYDTFREQHIVRIPDYEAYLAEHPHLEHYLPDIRRFIAVPLKISDKIIGHVQIVNPKEQVFQASSYLMMTLSRFIAIMIRKDDPAFKKAVDDSIKRQIADGSLAKLYDKWFMQPVPPTNTKIGLPLSDATKAAWANPNDKPMEDYAKK